MTASPASKATPNEAEELADWIMLHKASILNGMTTREQSEFALLFGKFRLSLMNGRAS